MSLEALNALTDQQKQAIADALESTRGEFDASICDQHGLNMIELAIVAVECSIVRCEYCGHWIAQSETTETSRDTSICDACINE